MLDLLRTDHMKIEAMLLQLRIIRDGDHRNRVLRQIRQELDRHMKIEEDILYPASREHVERLVGMVDEFYEEHQHVRDMIRDMLAMDASSVRFPKMVTHLITALEKHVHREEDQLFPSLRSSLEKRDLNRLNREVREAHSAVGKGPARKAA